MRRLFALSLFVFCLCSGSLRADCGQPHGETETPPETPSPTPSGEGDTGATGDTTVQGQLGTTLDPSQGLDRGGGTLLTTGVRSLYEPLDSYFELLTWVNKEVREIRSERAVRWAKNKARNDAGVEDAFEAWSQAGGDLADKMIRIDEIAREIVDVKHEIKMAEIYRDPTDKLQAKLDGLNQERVDTHLQAQEAAIERDQAHNRLLESKEHAGQLQQQYYNQAMEGK